jgi:hypothetical protein
MFNVPGGAYPPNLVSLTFNTNPGETNPYVSPFDITITAVNPTNWGIALKYSGPWGNTGWTYKGKLSGSMVVGNVFVNGTYTVNAALYNTGTGVINVNYLTYTWTYT